MTVASNTTHRRTRQQRMMDTAIRHIESARELGKEAAEIYGGMCHKLPVLIRSCGLCQAVAFVEAKAGGGSFRERAHALLRDHIKEVLQDENLVTDSQGAPSAAIHSMSLQTYALATRTLLRAWLFHKRFAEALLDATADKAERE